MKDVKLIINGYMVPYLSNTIELEKGYYIETNSLPYVYDPQKENLSYNCIESIKLELTRKDTKQLFSHLKRYPPSEEADFYMYNDHDSIKRKAHVTSEPADLTNGEIQVITVGII